MRLPSCLISRSKRKRRGQVSIFTEERNGCDVSVRFRTSCFITRNKRFYELLIRPEVSRHITKFRDEFFAEASNRK